MPSSKVQQRIWGLRSGRHAESRSLTGHNGVIPHWVLGMGQTLHMRAVTTVRRVIGVALY